MISSKLQAVFFCLELVAFEEYRSATLKRRGEICKKLGELEAKMVIKEIEKEVNKKYD